jgi:uncharacterized protein
MLKKVLIFLLIITLTATSISAVAAANTTAKSTHLNQSNNVISTYNTPYITTVNPKNGALNVAINKTIKIQFNQPVQYKTGWIEFRRDGILTAFKSSIDSKTLTIKPSVPMRMGSTYSVVLHSNSLTNLTGSGISYSVTRFSTAIRVDIINRATGGDISKNSLLYSSIQKTVLSNEILSKAKIGTPLVTFGDGNGPKVLIVAGVHGNELSAPAAAMKLINYLNGKHVRGTVYIIPFAIPYTAAHNTRYWHKKDPNRVAKISGSPTNLIVNLAKKLKVGVLGDFHSSVPGGVPGKDSALCTKIPMYSSYKIASYIAKYSGSTLIADRIAGQKYPGALEDVTNLNRIPAVTCEVLAYHNTLSTNRVNKSFRQMWGLLKYMGIE